MSIVTTTELKDYMSGIGLDADQASGAQDVLDGLQRELERYCQRPLERKERTETIVPDDEGRLWPKATPIVSVSSPEGLWPNGANGLGGSYPASFGLSMFGGGPYPVTITYVGGVEGEDEADIRLAILVIGARMVTNMHDDTRTATDLEGKQAQSADTRVQGWTDDELKKFDRLRRRTVV